MTIAETIVKENDRRQSVIKAPYNPYSGRGSIGPRHHVRINGLPIEDLWLPDAMMKDAWAKQLIRCHSVELYVKKEWQRMEKTGVDTSNLDFDENCLFVQRLFDYVRCRYDFAYYAASYIFIENKDGGPYIRFVLTFPQRELIWELEQMRLADLPIRLVFLKARQFGGSTAVQLYMSWLQNIVNFGLNVLIAAQVKQTASVIEAMYVRAMDNLPAEMLHTPGEPFDQKQPKMRGDRHSHNIHLIPARSCSIQIGTAQEPDSLRGSNFALVHCSEVAFWPNTPNNSPEKMVRDISGSVQTKPNTLIVYESTANGINDFFYNIYHAAKAGKSVFRSLFIPWFHIERYQQQFFDMPAKSTRQKSKSRLSTKAKKPVMLPAQVELFKAAGCPSTMIEFAQWLYDNRENRSVSDNLHEPGIYLWKLWQSGATLEGILWYILKRTEFPSGHDSMAAEYPSDDIEAFVNSGANVFDQYHVDKFRPACRPPQVVGDIYGEALPDLRETDRNAACLKNLKFVEDHQGELWIWEFPLSWEDPRSARDFKVTDRYVVGVDIGGRSNKADWSVIVVIDRLNMIDGGRPEVVAQWRGHIDHDLLAWKAAQIAMFYDNALLVIESNTLETHSSDNGLDGDQSAYILNVLKRCYNNLYARRQTDQEVNNRDQAVRYGFHTNTLTKPLIISGLVVYVREQLYVERDIRVLEEYNTYQRAKNGSFAAAEGHHDDLLMTRAFTLHICFNEMPLPKIIDAQSMYTGSSIKASEMNEATL